MADDKSKKNRTDRDRVSGSERYEVSYEARKTDTSPSQVKEAIEKEGPMREDVERALRSAKEQD